MIKQDKLLYLGSNGWKLHYYRRLFCIKFAHRYKKQFGHREVSNSYSLNEAYEIQLFLDGNKYFLEQKPTELHERVVAEAKALLDDEGNNIKDDYDYVDQRNKLRDAISELERNKK